MFGNDPPLGQILVGLRVVATGPRQLQAYPQILFLAQGFLKFRSHPLAHVPHPAHGEKQRQFQLCAAPAKRGHVGVQKQVQGFAPQPLLVG